MVSLRAPLYMPENAAVERVSLVKSCLPAKAVVKTSPEFRPELTDWLLIRGRLDNSGFLFYSEERGEHIYKAQVPFHAVSAKHMDAVLGCFRHHSLINIGHPVWAGHPI